MSNCEAILIIGNDCLYFVHGKTQKHPSEQYVQPGQTHELALRFLNPGLTKNRDRIQIQKYLIQIQTKYKTNINASIQIQNIDPNCMQIASAYYTGLIDFCSGG